MLSRLDPWVNLLRLTAAGFGAAVGGADAILLEPFTQPLGRPTEFARRQARNAQLVLMEESGLARVEDPAGGCWFLEAQTDQLARAAWSLFQQIEAAGGLAEALKAGLIAGWAMAGREALAAEAASGASKLVGVNVFRNPDEAPVAVDGLDPAPFARAAPDVRLAGGGRHLPAADALAGGASVREGAGVSMRLETFVLSALPARVPGLQSATAEIKSTPVRSRPATRGALGAQDESGRGEMGRAA